MFLRSQLLIEIPIRGKYIDNTGKTPLREYHLLITFAQVYGLLVQGIGSSLAQGRISCFDLPVITGIE